ncbi:P-loop containing nucleoside triphosphate hydrolase protein [Podospora aff. communis PSN243]|uniref:P-loop containing nucleoside triphosphate hydrolase protein n=1 Tax=Podospora aff. communis PSN243 TaxID=3040156 RepID=A0AAV9H0K3_9PEZI|nr:P-loop containing nucleoside triphosphate hydrolase protein [Podospora aff. communis PSN243]
MDSLTIAPALISVDAPLDGFLDWGAPPPLKNPNMVEEAGLICETVSFDSFYNSSGDRFILPAGQKYKDKQKRGLKSALSVTTHWDREHDFSHTVLDIRSPHMKAALKATVPEYASFNIANKHISIRGGPWCLYHYRQELREYGEKLTKRDYEAGMHVHHLLSYMWETFSNETLNFTIWADDPLGEPALDHKTLWMVYRPGDIVFMREKRLAFSFKEMSRLNNSDWKLFGHHIDFDGSEYGFREINVSIKAYDGYKLLRELNAAPFNRLPESEQQALKKELMARGRRFIGLREKQYLWYDGKCNLWPDSSQTAVKSRIVVDHMAYKTWGSRAPEVFLEDGKTKFGIDAVQEKISEKELMLCSKAVLGYCLKDNRWAVFDIDSISDISFDSEAFGALMFPEEQKKQILSLVRVHEDDRLGFDDFVKGKGRGMVFLLYGDPGTGKTLTAEGISDHCKKPLLRLDASTLGTSVGSVESGLTKTFKLAERWQALVLLDEADIYLEQRKSKNLTHNGLVSVFLRVLEYYQGILFLTTNRINSFDRAFMSRIHLALHYPPLTHHSRRELWYLFLKRASPDSAESLRQAGALDKFANENLNGRQIKNLVRTASALAFSSDSSADGRISQEYIEWALQPMKQFETHMASVFQREQEGDRHRREESAVAEEDQKHELQDDEDDGFQRSDEEEYEEDEEEEDNLEENEPTPMEQHDSSSDQSSDDEDDEDEDSDTPPAKRQRVDY